MLLPAVLVASAIAAAPGGGAFARGEVIPRVSCDADPRQTYALYLPSSYEPPKSWPILYLLDPSARGALAVERFRTAAEEHGWILAGSNVSRNGPMSLTVEAMRAMWDDTHRKLRLDSRRAYTGGFSGGARGAILVATLEPAIAGVIACGAGFPDDRSPNDKTSFALFATAGETDFNYWELGKLDRQLASLGKAHRLVEFDGGHRWPPEDVTREALDWLDLQAIRKDDADRAGLDALLERRLAKIRDLDAKGRIAQAHEERVAAVEDFRGLGDVSALEARLAADSRDRRLRKAISARDARERGEARELAELAPSFEAIRSGLPPPPLRQLIRDLRIPQLKSRSLSKDDGERSSARRVLEAIFARTFENLPEELLARGEPARALLALSVAAEIHPDSPRLWFRRARAHARSGDAAAAIADLRTAVANGFPSRSEIEQNPDLRVLRGQPAFADVLSDPRLPPEQ
jgi:tetratricopeptide (TPR) repeat protein